MKNWKKRGAIVAGGLVAVGVAAALVLNALNSNIALYVTPSDVAAGKSPHGQAFRIAHMGHVNAPMVLGTLGVIEVGLNALNIPHGKGGTEAAIEYLGESVEA